MADSLIPEDPMIIIPASGTAAYNALIEARKDKQAAERVKRVAKREMCVDCEHELDLIVERANAVADAMAKLIGVQCPVCCGKHHNYAEMTATDIGMGKCIRCGTAIGLEE